jgi:cysteine-rich repeat protein
MTSKLGRIGLAILAFTTITNDALAAPLPGHLYVASSEDGTIRDFTSGGSYASSAPYASGLGGPMAMCVDHTGALLVVSDFGIVDATAGGDLSMANPVITGKPFLSLDCGANRTLAAADGGEIYDVTAGGDFSSAVPFATVPGMPLGVLSTSTGTVYVSVLFQGVFDVTAGGDDGALVMPASGFFDAGLAEHQGEVFVASYTQLRHVPSGAVVASGPPFHALMSDGVDLFASNGSTVFKVAGSGFSTFATGAGGGGGLFGGTPMMVAIPECGDGVAHPSEACDTAVASASCDEDCTVPECGDGLLNAPAGEECDEGEGSASCDEDCTVAECGDGLLNQLAGEECDGGEGSASCDGDCTVAECGDGVQNGPAGESCDDGGWSATCDQDCTLAECGDGVLNEAAGEVCDEGGSSSTCTSSCTLPPTRCGNGVLEPGEQCDDGTETSACDLDCTLVLCGDGTVNDVAGEACDDGDEESGDGCSEDCALEGPGDGGSGTGGAGGDAGDDDGQAGAPVEPPVDEDEGGEGGCSTAGRRPSAPAGLLLALASLLWGRRRSAAGRLKRGA